LTATLQAEIGDGDGAGGGNNGTAAMTEWRPNNGIRTHAYSTFIFIKRLNKRITRSLH
jgi:hypothetical protein